MGNVPLVKVHADRFYPCWGSVQPYHLMQVNTPFRQCIPLDVLQPTVIKRARQFGHSVCLPVLRAGNVRYGEMPKQLGGFTNPPNIRGYHLVLCFVGPVELADNELGVRESLDMVSLCGVAKFYSCYEGLVFGLIVGCLEHEF